MLLFVDALFAQFHAKQHLMHSDVMLQDAIHSYSDIRTQQCYSRLMQRHPDVFSVQALPEPLSLSTLWQRMCSGSKAADTTPTAAATATTTAAV